MPPVRAPTRPLSRRGREKPRTHVTVRRSRLFVGFGRYNAFRSFCKTARIGLMTNQEAARGHAYRDGWFVVRDGLRLHYREYPGAADRPPLLCLHGLTRNARDFAALAERYSPEFRVLALDFRGRGGSNYDPLPTRYNPLTYASDVLELLDTLKIDEAVLVGTSLGGLVTMTLAVTAPQRIAASVLNDVGP